MKSYKEYEKKNIGESDGAFLVLIGCNSVGLAFKELDFGEDGSYSAYIVDDQAEIGSHYKKVASFNTWMKIYDDDTKTGDFQGKEINVFRSGEL